MVLGLGSGFKALVVCVQALRITSLGLLVLGSSFQGSGFRVYGLTKISEPSSTIT